MKLTENENFTFDLKDLTYTELCFIFDSLMLDEPDYADAWQDGTKKLARDIKNQFLDEHFKERNDD